MSKYSFKFKYKNENRYLYLPIIATLEHKAIEEVDNDSGGLEYLIVGGVLSGDAEMGAQLILNGAAHFIA